MRSRLLGFLSLSLLMWLALPGASRAWTEAHVREAHVRLDLSNGDTLGVLLDLVLEVRGGWLEGLELPGLDEGLVLAEHEPALAILESGERVPAQVSMRASTLLLKFARRDGLRRGLHHLQVRYTSSRAAHAELMSSGRTRLRWTLPGFEAGLGAASIELRGARGIAPVADPELAQDVMALEVEGSRVLRFSRLHVPRASPWTVLLELPRTHDVATKESARDAAAELGTRRWLGAGQLALVSLALAWLMRAHVARVLRKQRLRARGALSARPLSLLWMLALSLTAALSFGWASSLSLACWAALFVLSVPQVRARAAPLALGSFRPLTRAELRAFRSERWRERIGVPWADCCTLLGALGACLLVGLSLRSGYAGLGSDPWAVCGLCASLGWLASARSLRPRSVAEQVTLLLRAARRARVVGCALGLVAYASAGRLSQPRLRVQPAARYPGLLRLELLVDTRRSARPLVLSALVEAGSAAERWLSARFPDLVRESAAGGQRVALLLGIDDAGQSVEALLQHLSAESQRVLFERARDSQAA